MTRKVERVITSQQQLEGGGFVVRRPFPTEALSLVDPFLLLDEMGPAEYAAGEAVGAPDHPHRGFETVTYMLAGAFEHEDSAGNRGAITAGDVQWMTAGKGVVHSEMPSLEIREQGGRVHGFQIWVNLPARDKMTTPRYQAITNAQIPVVQLPGGAGELRLIAGRFNGAEGPALTFTELNVWDIRAKAATEQTLPLPAGHNAVIAVLGGRLQTAGRELGDGDTAIFDANGEGVQWRALQDSTVLALSGQPIGEAIAGYGPFVMNTREEIVAAFEDLQSGRFARLS
jgi:redox-sensitive bicupin YhaK (pirin superfamily)